MISAAIRDLGWSGAVVAIAVGFIAIATAVPLDASWRVAAAVVFVLLAPGASLVPLVGLRDTGIELALVIPLSITTLILTAVALFYTNTWTPDRVFGALVGICALALSCRVIVAIMGRRAGMDVSPTANWGTAGPSSDPTRGGG